MKALDESVIQDEHDSRGIPSPFLVPEQHLPDVTGVLDLGMAKAELPKQNERSRRANWVLTYQRTRDVYSTSAATTTVKIKPGTRPRTEYEYGKDMMARQMYSEKRSAAVCHFC
jgi:hypothetical protein